MDVNSFLREGKWLPSFALLDNNQTIYHFPPTAPDTPTRIFALNTQKTYPSKREMCEMLAVHLFRMARELTITHQQEATCCPYPARLKYLVCMLETVVADADLNGMRAEH